MRKWSADRLEEESLLPVLGVGFHRSWLGWGYGTIPAHPKRLFPTLQDGPRRHHPDEKLRRYACVLSLLKRYWSLAHANGFLPAFRGPDNVDQEILGDPDDLQKVTDWAVQAQNALPRHIEIRCGAPVGGVSDLVGEVGKVDSPCPGVWAPRRTRL